MMCRVVAFPTRDPRTPAATPLRQGGRGAPPLPREASAGAYALPAALREQVRRTVAQLYEARAGVRTASGSDMTRPPVPCWDHIEIHPDERAPHGVFFSRRPESGTPSSPSLGRGPRPGSR
jgi:hypothetical protein